MCACACSNESVYGQTRAVQQPSARHPAVLDVTATASGGGGARDLRSPREPIYGTQSGNSSSSPSDCYNANSQVQRCQVESYQMEPVYGTRRDLVVVQPPSRSESLYGRHKSPANAAAVATAAPYARNQEQSYTMPPHSAETQLSSNINASSNIVAIAASPSDTSKDSAYGSVHGTSMQSQSNEWQNSSNQQQQLQQQQQQQQQSELNHGHVAGNYSHHHHHHPGSSSYNNTHLYAQKFRSDLVSPKGHNAHSPSSSMTPASAFHSPVQY